MFCNRGKLRGSFCLQKRGAAPPPTPPLFQGHGCLQKKPGSSPASMLAPKTKHQVVAMWIIHACTRGKQRGSFCLQMGGGLRPPNPPRFLKAMDVCKKKQESGHRHDRCLHQKTSIRSSTCGSFMFCTRGKLRGSFCLQMGGAVPPPTPWFFKGHGCFQKKARVRSSPASMFAPKNKHRVVAVWVIHACTRWKLRGSFCLQMWGLCPPQPPRCLKAIDA